MEEIIRINSYAVKTALKILLKDKTTGKNILWTTDTFSTIENKNYAGEEITVGDLHYDPLIIQPRIKKAHAEQQKRTRTHAEVFTPAWVCNKMINYCDEDWFGRKNVFNEEKENSWRNAEDKIQFPENKDWRKYIDCRRLEITCGEAPYIVSRYDAASGEKIPLKERIGILDRKLRVVNENTETEEEWLKWAARAFQSVYGYEYQGDSLLTCRMNLLLTFEEYYMERWGKEPSESLLKTTANIISWNFWQMDGLSGTTKKSIPGTPRTLMDLEEDEKADTLDMPCKIYDWRKEKTLYFNRGNDMIFDYVIGNPPYQEEQVSENANGSLKNYAPPVYDKFMSAAFGVSEKVELIHPARFLFNAGSTPKEWNKKMLNDKHFKVLHFEIDSGKIFFNTDIKGGIAITYRDSQKDFGMIETFTPFAELNSIMQKVKNSPAFKSIWDIVISRTAYRLTPKMHEDHPEAESQLSKGHLYDMASNIFNRLPQIFYDEKPNDNYEYIRILGREGINRVYKYIRRDYVKDVVNLEKYKVIVPQANGSGAIGEVLSTPLIGEPLIGEPLIGETETFISIGAFDTREETESCLKYIKSKFARTMLGVLKVTQNNNRDVWKYVPLQDFTENSDIDWSKSIHEIDLQLYRKYGLDEKEIEFIETHVKEME